MLKPKVNNTVASLVLGVACLATAPVVSRAASPVQLSGVISGVVANPAGMPQMGATVLIMNAQDRIFGKVITDANGEFKFDGLFPAVYTLKVTLATFVPAMKRNILVQPGMRSVLNVSLNSLFSTIKFAYPPIEAGATMSEDWKWMLRSATVTRPVLRFLDPANSPSTARAAVFSETRGIFKLSAGEGGTSTGVGNEADLGTAFALATSLYGNSSIQVSGNLGYGSQTGVPAAAFRTSYSHNLAGGSPEVSLTMRQLLAPGRLGAAFTGNESALPSLRTMSAGLQDRTQIVDGLTLQYGATLDSVSFLDHLNYFSPFARLSYSMGDAGELDFAFTSGNARPDLAAAGAPETDLQHDLSTLGVFPRVSLRDGHAKVQRGQEYEVIYTRKIGSRTFRLSAYHESVSNAALSMVAPDGMFANGDRLPDLFTGASTFNAGDLKSAGYTAAVTQNIGDRVSATIEYGSAGGLTAERRELVSESPDELRAMIHAGRRHSATGRIMATVPKAGTHMIASYQWTADRRMAMPGNLYTTQDFRPMTGLNVYVRQPIPGLSVLPWRMEATADLRNLLAQGYLPIGTASGQTVLLVESPRSFRGGLSFIF